jgi:hypothetical protein
MEATRIVPVASKRRMAADCAASAGSFKLTEDSRLG